MSGRTVGRRVVVIGGTGAVGREVAALVADERTEVVVVARDGERAAAVARSVAARTAGRAVARRADVADWAERAAALAGATVVVTCVERANADLAGEALAQGAHVVDISASPEILASIERLGGVALAHGTTAVLGVGLAPGLTNLLARACIDRLPEATDAAAVDIAVLIGLGEHHGTDAIRWTLDGLATPTPAPAPTPPLPTARNAGAGRAGRRRKVALPGFGRRTAHPFPFADQHTLARTLGTPVTTRLCFDSRAVTALAFALRRTGLLGHLPRGPLARGLARVHLGSDRYAVAVTATAAGGERVTATATGRRQSYATAVVTADVVRRLLDGEIAPGVHQIDQAIAAGDALTAAASAGITIEIRGSHVLGSGSLV